MKKLSIEEMESIQGGAYIDCALMIAGFAGAVAASSTGVGILFGALSFAGGVRSAMACEGSNSWFYKAPVNSSKFDVTQISDVDISKYTLSN